LSQEYVIYCDESLDHGKYFSNFYGGVLVRSSDLQQIHSLLLQRKTELNLLKEVKWSKVTGQYLSKYLDLMETFFDLVEADKIKTRIMFTQNSIISKNLRSEQIENEYFLLYYQFVKHSFGLQYSNPSNLLIKVRLYFDDLPDTKEKAANFKAYIASLNSFRQFEDANIKISLDQIAEIKSHDHPILQCLDVVLGSMQFRLNDKHKEKPEGSRVRGKRTIAKDKLYQYISQRIRKIYPNFNIGVSTSRSDIRNVWLHPYRHWLFKPREYEIDLSKTK
jgi:hypothetical protein